MNNKKFAFTLAEMMVVMLIMSIVMAAFAPVMTTRQKRDISSPWRFSDNQMDAYFGLGSDQRAMIGQKNRPTTGTGDPDNRLTIQTSRDTQSHILFKGSDDSVLGSLSLKSGYISLGNISSGGGTDVYGVAIGKNLTIPTSVSGSGQDFVAIGNGAHSVAGTVAIGDLALAQANGSISIGERSGMTSTSSKSIAIGSEVEIDGENSIALGVDTGANYELSGNNSILIGKGAVNGNNSIA
ncbi:MAG: prepilin-type N-terminal cleavage/methylation domain-containing protein, partial [Candidatus Gastranaerophilaceae bacterium]